MSPESSAIEPFAPYFSRPTAIVLADLTAFAAILRRWNETQNLVSRGTLDKLWSRHIADGLQVLPLLEKSDENLVDLGSGGGVPGLVLALDWPDSYWTLVDANGRRPQLRDAGPVIHP